MNKNADKNQDQEPVDPMINNTIMPGNEAIENMPDTGDDYRMPRDLPETDSDETEENTDRDGEELIDDQTEISAEELALLDSTDYDDSSDESAAADLLDSEDEDGDELNEGSGDGSYFDTGDDLDMPRNITNPDADWDEEES